MKIVLDLCLGAAFLFVVVCLAAIGTAIVMMFAEVAGGDDIKVLVLLLLVVTVAWALGHILRTKTGG